MITNKDTEQTIDILDRLKIFISKASDKEDKKLLTEIKDIFTNEVDIFTGGISDDLIKELHRELTKYFKKNKINKDCYPQTVKKFKLMRDFRSFSNNDIPYYKCLTIQYIDPEFCEDYSDDAHDKFLYEFSEKHGVSVRNDLNIYGM